MKDIIMIWSLSGLHSIIQNISRYWHFPDIFQETEIYDSAKWKVFHNLDVKDIPIPEEFKSKLQQNCPFWPGKKVAETHFLCLGLRSRDISKLPFFNEVDSYFPKENQDAHWFLITKKNIPNSAGLDLEQQKDLLKRSGYDMPYLVEAVTTIHASKDLGQTLFPKLGEYTRCHELYNNHPIAVGSDSTTTVSIYANDWNFLNGVAGVIRLSSPTAL